MALRVAVRALGEASSTVGPLPDLTRRARRQVPHRYLAWAERLVAEAVGRPPPGPGRSEEELVRLGAAAKAWPVLVSHPFGQLVEHYGEGRYRAGAMFLRDSAEGVVRMLWLVLAYRAWNALRSMEGQPQTEVEQAAVYVLRTLREHTFSFGVAIHVMSSKAARPLWDQDAVPSLPPQSRKLWSPLRGLAEWRNDLAHGVASSERELKGALTKPLGRMVRVLDRLGGWLCEAQDWAVGAGWPTELGPSTLKEWTALPAPIAWADPRRSLWVLERIEANGLRVRDVEQNETAVLQDLQVLDALLWWTRDVGEARGAEISARRAQLLADPERQAIVDPIVAEISTRLLHGGAVRLRGEPGTGKSVLLAQVARALRRDGAVVLSYVPVPGRPFVSDDVRDAFAAQLRGGTALRLPTSRTGAESVLPPQLADAPAWWARVRELNPGVPIVLLVDALDAADDSGRAEAWVRVEGVASIVSSRRADLPTEASDLALDLGAHYRGAGERTLRRYLKTAHPDIKPHHSHILELAAGRFLWVCHYARGLERTGAAPDRDPARFYAGLVGWLEERVGGHPGYVRCLRRALITPGEVGMPLSEAALSELLGDPGESSVPWRDWLGPVVADLDDVVHHHALADGPTGLDALAIHGAGAGHLTVLGIPHEPLIGWLQGDALPDAWAEERRAVRQTLARWGASSSTAPQTAAERFGLVRAVELAVRAGEDRSAALERALAVYPLEDDVLASREPALWVAAARARARAASEGSAGALAAWQFGVAQLASREPASALATALGALAAPHGDLGDRLRLLAGRAAVDELAYEQALELLDGARGDGAPTVNVQLLTTAGDAALKSNDRAGALARHEAAVALARASFPGEAATWCTTWPDAGRAVALALDGVGQGLRANGRADEAVAAHEEAQVWWRALGHTGRPGPRRELAVALRRLGRARRDVQADGAVTVHEEEVELARAALPPDASPHEVAAACPALGQALALALGNLGQALSAADRSADAVPVHQEEVWWFRPLADIGPDVRASARGRPRASRELAYALGNLALALAAERSPDAPAAMRESRALMWGLHDLAEADALPGPEVPASIRRDVALVEVRLAEILLAVGQREEALRRLAVLERTPRVDELRDIAEGIRRCKGVRPKDVRS